MEEIHQRPVLLMGPPGIGKTAIMEQIARECGIGLVAYTITHHTRQSAMGLPIITEREYAGESYQITTYTMSEIIGAVYEKMEESGLSEGILFIDEINCVSETLAPMMLQFLQGKTFGSWKLPAGWVIVAAGNPTAYNRHAREFDIVTLDRVKKLEVTEDFSVWKEYAYRNSIHPAILSYLEIKKENFYHVETGIDGVRFVTARGWEDLSEMLYAYEEAKIPISRELVGAYVQEGRIAGDFAAYYDLYNKYQEHYRITDILSGNHDKELVSRFAKAAFDERLSVIGLLLGAMHSQFVAAYEAEQVMTEVFQVLQEIKGKIEGMQASKESFLATAYKERSRSWEKEQKAGLADREQQLIRQRALLLLEEYQKRLKEEGLSVEQECFPRLKEWFGSFVKEEEEKTERIKDQLEHAFSYLEEAFGSGQEMVIFVTELTADFYSMQFIGTHGSEKYYQYNSALLLKDKRKELQQDVAALLDRL